MTEKKALLVIDLQNDYLWEKRKRIFTYDTDQLVGAAGFSELEDVKFFVICKKLVDK